MSSTIHGARLTLSLYTLSDESNVPAANKGTKLGELISVSASFSLNDVPVAEVEVPLGRKLGAFGELEDSYAYETALRNALQTRKPLGVYLTVEKIGETALSGLEEGELCLFKGYTTNASEENGINGGTMRLSLTHWMCDLSIFPILHRMSSPENSADVACDAVFQERAESGNSGTTSSTLTGTAWTPAKAYSDAMNNSGNDLLAAIKIGFGSALDQGKELKEDDAGFVNSELFSKVSNALDALKSKSLEFNSDLNTDGKMFRYSIADALATENRNSYFSVTLWQKLVQTMLPQFYASIIPLVNEGLVVPQPGIHMDSAKAIPIDKNVMMSLRTRTAFGKTLGGVVLAGRAISSAGPFGTAVSNIKRYKYPKEQKPGVMKVCYMPAWIESYMALLDRRIEPITKNGLCSEKASTTAEDEHKKLKEKSEKALSDFEKFADAFTRSVYYAEATKGNAATLTTVLDLDICPGMVVKIPVPSDVTFNDEHNCYATIHTAQYTIGPETAASTFVLSNVRTEDQMKEMNTTDAIFYKSGWYDNTQKLYVKES